MKAIIFTRVSTKEQADEGYSLEAQEKLLSAYADEHNFKVVKVYKIAETASKEQVRKLFKEVFQFTDKNNVDVILCEKIDRLTRNPKDAGIADDWVHAVLGREIHFVKESFVLNGNTRAHESLVWDMKVAIARFYSNNLSEEVKKGHKEKVAQGWYPSKAPLGYKSVGEKGHKTHVLDSSKAPLLRRMFELYSTGRYSLLALVEKMNDEGLRTYSSGKLGKSRMHGLLSDPFYYGEILWGGKIHPGKQEPLITRELFDKVQDVLHGKAVPRHNKHVFVFKGFLRCVDCGGLVTWEAHKGHPYGHCNKYNQCEVREWYKEAVLQEQLLPTFRKLKVDSHRLIEWGKKALKETNKGDIEYNTTALAELQQQLTMIQNRLDRLYDDKLDQKITEDMYQRKFEQYTAEKKIVERGMAKHAGKDTKYQELGALLHDLSQRAEELFSKANVVQKRKLINLVLTNMRIENGYITYDYTAPFQSMCRIAYTSNAIKIYEDRLLTDELLQSFDFVAYYSEKQTIEPPEKGLGKTQSTTFEVMRSVWLDVVAEVRKAIREHEGYIYIPDLKPKGESVAGDVVGRVTAR